MVGQRTTRPGGSLSDAELARMYRLRPDFMAGNPDCVFDNERQPLKYHDLFDRADAQSKALSSNNMDVYLELDPTLLSGPCECLLGLRVPRLCTVAFTKRELSRVHFDRIVLPSFMELSLADTGEVLMDRVGPGGGGSGGDNNSDGAAPTQEDEERTLASYGVNQGTTLRLSLTYGDYFEALRVSGQPRGGGLVRERRGQWDGAAGRAAAAGAAATGAADRAGLAAGAAATGAADRAAAAGAAATGAADRAAAAGAAATGAADRAAAGAAATGAVGRAGAAVERPAPVAAAQEAVAVAQRPATATAAAAVAGTEAAARVRRLAAAGAAAAGVDGEAAAGPSRGAQLAALDRRPRLRAKRRNQAPQPGPGMAAAPAVRGAHHDDGGDRNPEEDADAVEEDADEVEEALPLAAGSPAKKKHWTREETLALLDGMLQYKGRFFAYIKKDPDYSEQLRGRSGVDCKDRWENLRRAAKRGWTGSRGPFAAILNDPVVQSKTEELLELLEGWRRA